MIKYHRPEILIRHVETAVKYKLRISNHLILNIKKSLVLLKYHIETGI